MTSARDARAPGRRPAAAILTLVCTVQFVDVLGVTVLVVALPSIRQQMRLDGSELSWTAAIYPLIFGGVLVPAGRAADIAGHWRLFTLGNALVTAGAMCCTFAGNAATLLTGRAVQGLGAAVSVPAALAALLATFPAGPPRDWALGVWTVAGGIGGAFGFAVGGLVTQLVGWRWLFAAMALLGAAATAAAAGYLALGSPGAAGHKFQDTAGDRATVDLLGALLCVTTVALLILGFNQAQDHGFASPSAWVPLVLVPGAAGAFTLAERRARSPLIPPRIWALPPFRVAAGVAAVLTLTTSGANVVGTLFLQRTMSLSAGLSGAAFLLFSAAVVGGSLIGPLVIARWSAITAVSTGLVVIVLAMGAQAAGAWQHNLAAFLAGLAGSGVGLGIASVGSTIYGTSSATHSTAGVIGGLLNAAAQVGTAVGIAALLVAADNASAGPVTAYLVAAGTAAAALVVTAVHRRGADRTAPRRPKGRAHFQIPG